MSATIETMTLSRDYPHPVAAVWEAFADPAVRSDWSVPDGDELVYERDDFRSGGSAAFRCGTPGSPEYSVTAQYIRVVEAESVTYLESASRDGSLLATGLLTWTWSSSTQGTRLTITDHVVSFVGEGFIEGSRNGHTMALRQLAEYLGR